MVCVELILPMVCFQTYYLIFIFNPLSLYLLLKQLFYHVHFMGHEAQNGGVTKYCALSPDLSEKQPELLVPSLALFP